MVSIDGSNWESLSADYGFDYNWNIAAFVSPNSNNDRIAIPLIQDSGSKQSKQITNRQIAKNNGRESNKNKNKGLLGFNIYRDGTLLTFTTNQCIDDLCLEPQMTYTYQVTAVYDEGESDPSNVLSVTVPPIPSPENLTLSLDNGDIILNWNGVKGFDGYNVYHSFESGTFELLNAQPLSETTYTFSDPDVGYHEFKVTAVFCEYESDPSNIQGITITGIGENISLLTKIYPNPASGIVKISSAEIINNIRLFSNSGQLLIDADVKANDTKIDMSGFENGVYLLKIETGKTVIVNKIIKN